MANKSISREGGNIWREEERSSRAIRCDSPLTPITTAALSGSPLSNRHGNRDDAYNNDDIAQEKHVTSKRHYERVEPSPPPSGPSIDFQGDSR